MTKNQKILLGVGAVALVYYFYTTNKNKAVANQQPSTPNSTGGIVPTQPNYVPKMPRVKGDQELIYEFIKDYQSNPNGITTRMISWNFNKGQKIKGMPDYANCSLGGGLCPIKTTTKGEFQTSQNQMYWITIPQGYLKITN